MDSQTKVNVDFKPAKRMKKRRELDALVNGKQPPSFRGNSRMRNGKHELLRNDSDSSEVEEFILPEKSLIRNRRGHSTFCSVCVNICWGFLLFMCLVGIGGLVWMCVQLKTDVDQLRVQLDKVEMQNSIIPGEIRNSISELDKTNLRLSQLESGDQGIEKLQENFTLLMKQMSDLEAMTKTLSQSVANAPQLLALQSVSQQVKDLSRHVADLGSNLQTMEQSVNQLNEANTAAKHQLSDFDARLQTLQLATSEQKSTEHQDIVGSLEDIARLDGLMKSVNLMNITFYTYIQDLRAKYNSEHVSVLELFNFTNLLNTRVTFLEVRPTIQPPTQDELASAVTASIQNVLEELRNTSRDQDLEIKTNKARSDDVIAILQAQITGHESKISLLTDRINKVNVSVVDLENTVDLRVEMLNSKYQLLSKELKVGESGGNLKSTGSEAEPSPTPAQPADVVADDSSTLSSTSSTLALSLFSNGRNQNFNMLTAQNGSSPLN